MSRLEDRKKESSEAAERLIGTGVKPARLVMEGEFRSDGERVGSEMLATLALKFVSLDGVWQAFQEYAVGAVADSGMGEVAPGVLVWWMLLPRERVVELVHRIGLASYEEYIRTGGEALTAEAGQEPDPYREHGYGHDYGGGRPQDIT